MVIGAVDIGGTKIAVGVLDRSGKILSRTEFPTATVRDDPNRAVQKIQSSFNDSCCTIEGIGISCTGPVYPQEGRVGDVAFLPGWRDFNLTEAIGNALGVGATLENDADAAAFGEWKCGVGQGAHRFIMVTIGTGIGVGIILDGRIYRGAGGSHPEFGHHVIEADGGPECYCGAKGCWESLASGKALEDWARSRYPEKGPLTGREICRMASTGDEFALAMIRRTAGYLGIGTANIINMWMPEMICFCGGLMHSRDLFLPGIREVIHQNCGLVPFENVKLTTSLLGGDAGLVGAAQLWLESMK